MSHALEFVSRTEGELFFIESVATVGLPMPLKIDGGHEIGREMCLGRSRGS